MRAEGDAIIQANTSLEKTYASVLLDLLRGLAALLVLVGHWRNFLFVDYTQLTVHRRWFALPYVLTSGGHQAVVIFFVMSGYLISGSVFRMLDRGVWSWVTYLIHRLVRLWVVLLPGLLLCLFWDSIGLHFHLAPALYGGANYNHITSDVRAALTPKLFLLNLFFLQGIAGPQFGSDGALWSLANEFWYYILFPLGLLAVYRSAKTTIRPWTRILCAILFLLIAWWLRQNVLMGFPLWLAGTLLYLLPVLKLSGRVRLLASAAYIPILFFIAKTHRISQVVGDYLLAVATFFLLWILLSATQIAKPSFGERTSRELARFSYTLYVVHMPFLVLLTAVAAGSTRWTPDLPHILEAVAILALALAYAYGVAAVTEFQTDTWRRRIESMMGRNARQDRSRAVSRT